MNARYTQGYFLSCLLHGAVIAAVLLLAYLANQAGMEKPKVFELVAGEGDNYGATEAPAIGVPGGIKVVLPPAPSPIPPVEVPPSPPVEAPAPPTAESVPIEPVPVPVPAAKPKPRPHPAPTKAKPVTKKDATPNFTRTVERTAHRTAARLERKYRRQLEEEQRKKMSYDEYLKEHGDSRSNPEGIRGGVLGGSAANKTGGAGGKAMTREDSSLLDAYFALLKARSHENFEPPTDVSEKLVARVSFYVAADGSLSRVHIVRSSGNAAFDQAVLEAFRRTRSIGPRPDHRGDEVVLSFSLREEDSE